MTPPASHDALGPRSSADALLESMERVRALAGQIVRQAADQDDLVQEAVTRALTRPSTVVGESGPWVRRVVKNLAIDRQRSSARRQGRELSTVEGDAALESTADSVARAECQRDMVDAVLKLPEPYRAVILARFFDGLPPREIARKHDVPVATVKKQQERGMALLRKELEGRYGKDGAWAVALLPILPKAALRSLAAKGVGAGSLAVAPRWFALAAVVLAGVAAPAFWLLDGRGVDAPTPAVVPTPLPGDSAVAFQRPTPGELREVASPPVMQRSPEASKDPVASSVDVLRTFTGRFVDEAGAPIAGVTATCRTAPDPSGAMPAMVGPTGRGSEAGIVFASLSAPLDQTMLVEVEAQGYAPAAYRFAPGPRSEEAVIDVGRQTLHRPADLHVRVVDTSGAVLPGWEMSYFHYGGGQRLERGRALPDEASGWATFHGIAAAEVELMARHSSGLEIHRPRRSLRPGGENHVDLVHLGPDPSRRVGVELEWPAAMGSRERRRSEPRDGGDVSFELKRDDRTVASLTVHPGEDRAGFDDLTPGFYSVVLQDPRFEFVEVPVEVGRCAKVALNGTGRLSLTLRDLDGARIPDVSVEVGQSGARALIPVEMEEGSLVVGLVPGQAFVLRATAPDGAEAMHELEALAPHETRIVEMTVGDGLTPIRVEAVRDPDARPVAGAEVALFQGVIEPGSPMMARAIAQVGKPNPTGSPRRLAEGKTDEHGRASLDVATHELGERLTAVVLAGDHATGRVVDGSVRCVLPALGAVRILASGLPDEVTRGGSLPEGVALTLTWPGSVARAHAAFGPGVVLDRAGDGSFETGLAPAGPATVWLSLSDFNHTGRGTPLGGVTGPVGYPLGHVEVRPGSTVETEVDLGSLWPGRLEVVVRQAGRVLTDAVVELEPVGSHAHLPYPFGADVEVSRVFSRLTDGSGRALFERVPRGQWRVRVRDIEWLWATTGGELDLQQGQRERLELVVELAEGEVTLLDASGGEPLRQTAVALELAPGRWVRRITDGDGRLALRLGPGQYAVALDAGEGEAPRAPAATLEWGLDGPLEGQLRLFE